MVKAKMLGHSFRPVTSSYEPFTELTFKIRYTSKTKDPKIVHYWKEDNVIQRELYRPINLESYPNRGEK